MTTLTERVVFEGVVMSPSTLVWRAVRRQATVDVGLTKVGIGQWAVGRGRWSLYGDSDEIGTSALSPN